MISSEQCHGPSPLAQCLHETTIQSFFHVFCPICHNLPQSQKTVRVHRLYIDFLIHTTAVKWADSLKIPMQCGAAENSWTDSCKMPMQCGAAVIRQRSDNDQTVKSEFKSLSHGDIALMERPHKQ